MTTEQIEEQAKALLESATIACIHWWVETWRTMKPNHEQYHMRADQLAIGRRALKL